MALLLSYCALAAADCEATNISRELSDVGFVVIRNAVDPDRARAAAAALQRSPWWTRDAVWLRRTERIGQVLELDPVFGAILDGISDDVHLALADVMGPDWLLGAYHALILHPETAALSAAGRERVLRENLHSDYPYGHSTEFHGGSASAVLPGQPPTVGLLWMLSEFSAENGATLLWPRSHVSRRLPNRMGDEASAADFAEFRAGAVPVTGSPGDLLLYVGQVPSPRRAVTSRPRDPATLPHDTHRRSHRAPRRCGTRSVSTRQPRRGPRFWVRASRTTSSRWRRTHGRCRGARRRR